MDQDAVMKAVASDTLFIHGSLTGGGGSMFKARGAAPAVSPALRLLGESNRPAERCKATCGAKSRRVPGGGGGGGGDALPGTGTVCDRSCYAAGERGARFGGHLCGAGDVAGYGAHCRVCYNDLEEARAAEEALLEEERRALRRKSGGKSRAARSVGSGNGNGNGNGNDNNDNVTADAREKKKSSKKNRRRVLRADGSGGAEWSERREGDGEVEMGVVKEGGEGKEEENEEDEEEHRGLRGHGQMGGALWGGHGDGGFDDDAGDGDMMVERRRHVIMCDTLMPPPPATGCSSKCQRKDDTVRLDDVAL